MATCLQVHVFDTPGHTRGHITFWAPSAQALFPGACAEQGAAGCSRVQQGAAGCSRARGSCWPAPSQLCPWVAITLPSPGDTLFSLGCGRLFEVRAGAGGQQTQRAGLTSLRCLLPVKGSPQQMWVSLSKLLPLPDDTRGRCGPQPEGASGRPAPPPSALHSLLSPACWPGPAVFCAHEYTQSNARFAVSLGKEDALRMPRPALRCTGSSAAGGATCA